MGKKKQNKGLLSCKQTLNMQVIYLKPLVTFLLIKSSFFVANGLCRHCGKTSGVRKFLQPHIKETGTFILSQRENRLC